MGMVVTHLVFASTSCADCETLHDRRKVMVSTILQSLRLNRPEPWTCSTCMPVHLSPVAKLALNTACADARYVLTKTVCMTAQVTREYCAEVRLTSYHIL